MRKSWTLLLLVFSLIAFSILTASAPLLRAQQPRDSAAEAGDQPAVSEAMASVASALTYQGLLEEDGVRVTGSRSLTFQLHTNAACTSSAGGTVNLPDVAVEDGLFSVDVPVDPTQITGQARWLQVSVGGAPIGCQELLPVPYALSLRPGALISGDAGLAVESSDPAGVALVGRALAGSGATTGVRGETGSQSGYAGYFENSASTVVGADVVLGGTATNDEGNLFSDPTLISSDMYLRSNDEIWINLDENNDEDATFRVRSGTNASVFTVDESGNTSATGTKSAIVQTAQGDYRKLYAVESPVVVFEDFGSARLEQGAATVTIDPVFAGTVSLADYQVFLMPVDGWAALYVTNKTPTSFDVRDAQGSASINFDYRIVAKRAGYEDVRLAPVDSGLGPSSQQPSAAESDE